MTMHTDLNTPTSASTSGMTGMGAGEPQQGAALHALANYQIIRRNGAVVPFEPKRSPWP